MGQAVTVVVPWWNKGEQGTTWRKKNLTARKNLSRCRKSQFACDPCQFMMSLQGRGDEKRGGGKCEDYEERHKADIGFT
jgi:hypothetical protein